MDAVDEFLGKDCGESKFCLYNMLTRLITFGSWLMTAAVWAHIAVAVSLL